MTGVFALALVLPACALPARADAPPDSAIAAPLAPPAVPAEEFPVVLGSFTTTLSGSRPERTANVRLAAEALDGTVLAPGEVLSFNAIVGPRTPARGYQDAPVILHETRQLQTGGGVCQAASTVFAAGLLSGMVCIERFRHSSPVDYIAPGEDATIAWGAKDMRLRNDLSQRIRLRVRVVGSTLSARFEGESPLPCTYDLETHVRDVPADDAGATPGREIELFRVRTGGDGGESRELVHRDLYPPSRGARPSP